LSNGCNNEKLLSIFWQRLLKLIVQVEKMDGQIFINYRRDDSSASAGRLYDRLSSHFASNQIFIDVDNLAPGVDFVEAIEESVGSCDVLIAVIGRRWLTSSDEQGRRRLDNPDDFVRIEISTALKRNVRVIPVLVDGASMPLSRDLPDDLKPLVRRNAFEVSHTRFSSDCKRLAGAVERVLEKTTEKRREREEKERLEAERSGTEAKVPPRTDVTERLGSVPPPSGETIPPGTVPPASEPPASLSRTRRAPLPPPEEPEPKRALIWGVLALISLIAGAVIWFSLNPEEAKQTPVVEGTQR
jgi:hypothetical protein